MNDQSEQDSPSGKNYIRIGNPSLEQIRQQIETYSGIDGVPEGRIIQRAMQIYVLIRTKQQDDWRFVGTDLKNRGYMIVLPNLAEIEKYSRPS